MLISTILHLAVRNLLFARPSPLLLPIPRSSTSPFASSGTAAPQAALLASKQPHVLIATPGRLLDLVDGGELKLQVWLGAAARHAHTHAHAAHDTSHSRCSRCRVSLLIFAGRKTQLSSYSLPFTGLSGCRLRGLGRGRQDALAGLQAAAGAPAGLAAARQAGACSCSGRGRRTRSLLGEGGQEQEAQGGGGRGSSGRGCGCAGGRRSGRAVCRRSFSACCAAPGRASAPPSPSTAL